MSLIRRGLAAALVLSFAAIAGAQGTEPANCILAGRLADDGHWAPRFEGIELLGQDGRRITGGKAALGQVKQARLAQPSLLSRCDGSNALRRADDDPVTAKQPAPAVSAGLVEVELVSFPPLRTGGELVELKVRVPADRVVMLTR